jgi:molybdopterin converting factor small subunit
MASIQVNVKLFGTLRDRVAGVYDHEKGIDVPLREGATIRELLSVIGLSEKEAGFFVVNEVSKKLTDRLNDCDEIGIFLPLAGG